MSKQIIRVTTGGNPTKGQEAYMFKNSYNEWKATTRKLYSSKFVGYFMSKKDENNQVDIELEEEIIEVYEGNKKLTLTIGTTVEVQEIP